MQNFTATLRFVHFPLFPVLRRLTTNTKQRCYVSRVLSAAAQLSAVLSNGPSPPPPLLSNCRPTNTQVLKYEAAAVRDEDPLLT